ncbi:AraC family transcriptional regulator [Alicyclobacillus fastidiosus]|uniref:AraC family transcriptional regulator n=1 Tax=Alicyclobacillus fastidiosus TaxID=392011 RepID=A0ABY6ZAS8_9BACL|nr:AraC family transcriptional regulator [Alicyclobacillus fastidiosus]WAH39868.1 AraC family transcriptional regulator [Alicyclobacillus fastidiosus]
MNEIDYQTNRILIEDTVYVQYRKTSRAPNIEYPHRHHGYEIYYFQSGAATYIIGETIYTLSPGDMLIFRGDILHLVRPVPKSACLRSIINFKFSDVDDLLDPTIQQKLKLLFDAANGTHVHWRQEECRSIEHLFFTVAEESRHREVGARNIIRLQLVTLLLRILRNYEGMCSRKIRPPALGRQETHVVKILKVLNQRFRDKLSLDQLANAVHLNKHYICHCFKSISGLTINQYLVNLRIDESKKLLLETNKPINIIAEEVGVGGVAQFSRLFRQHVGMAPQVFRKTSRRLGQNECGHEYLKSLQQYSLNDEQYL